MNRKRCVAVGYGTRPQVIKAARLLPALARQFSLLAIDTGQHYDHELNALLYRQLEVPRPHAFLGVGSDSREKQLEAIERACTEALRSHHPDAMVVIGDTNSTLGCARAAAALGIPVVHVEAGLRSHVAHMAEELNRVEVDHVSSLLCAPSRRAMMELSKEGLAERAVLTGDVARDVLNFCRSRSQRSTDWPIERGAPYVFSTLHRAELTNDPGLLRQTIDALSNLALPVVLAIHPRTRAALGSVGHFAGRGALHIVAPVGYLESLAAIEHATCVVTDSGGVQREAYWLGVPCVTLRRETEWAETIDCGANRLIDPVRATGDLSAMVHAALEGHVGWDRDHYGQGCAAAEIVAAMCMMPELRSAFADAR